MHLYIIICTTICTTTVLHRSQQLIFCDTILERNRRVLNTSQDYHLDTFFPFDPYMLKESNVFINSLYQEYVPNGTEDLQDDDSVS